MAKQTQTQSKPEQQPVTPPVVVAPPIEPPVESVEPVKSELEMLQDLRAELEAGLAQAERAVIQAEQVRDEATRALDDVLLEIQKHGGRYDNQLEIQAYIKTSNEQRAARAARVNELLEMGAEPGELSASAKSPLDVAIAMRNRNKFAHRPQFKKAAA